MDEYKSLAHGGGQAGSQGRARCQEGRDNLNMLTSSSTYVFTLTALAGSSTTCCSVLVLAASYITGLTLVD